MQYATTTAPTVELDTLTNVKRYLRVGHSQEDDVIDDLITSTRLELEERLGRSFLSQTITLYLDAKDNHDPVWLPRPPALAITSVTEIDADNNETVVASSQYRLAALDPGRLVKVGAGFDVERDVDGLKIIYTAGYGTAATDVPAAIRAEWRHLLWVRWRDRAADIALTAAMDAYRYGHLGV